MPSVSVACGFSPTARTRSPKGVRNSTQAVTPTIANMAKKIGLFVNSCGPTMGMSDSSGRAIGLVDELGGLDRAIAAAKQRAKIPADSSVEVVVYPPKRSVYELLSKGFQADDSAIRAIVPNEQDRRVLAALASPLRLFRAGEPLAIMPNVFFR